MERLIRSFGFAFNGFKSCTLKEANFKIHCFSSLLVIIAGFIFTISLTEWMLILICTGFVLCMEMMNTAIEQLCDVVHKEIHPAIRVIKDISAGAVLVSAIIAAICGAVIFIPKILLVIKSIKHS